MSRTFASTYREIYGQAQPESVHYGESQTDIIRAGRGFIEGFDFTMQTQVGCPGGCLFCYVPSGKMLTPATMRGEHGERWGFEVRLKEKVIEKLATHLHDGKLADKTVYWSGVTDPYAARASQTQAVWQTLIDTPAHLRPKRIVVQTRYHPDRDAERIAVYTHSTIPSDCGPAVVVSYSIGTDRDDLIRAWERATPPFSQRLKAIQTLRQAGVFVVPTLSPFGLWNDLSGTLRQFRDWHIHYITCLFFKENTESANTPNRFLHYLKREYPTLLDTHWQTEQLHLMREIYGRSRVLVGKTGFASLAAPHLVI